MIEDNAGDYPVRVYSFRPVLHRRKMEVGLPVGVFMCIGSRFLRQQGAFVRVTDFFRSHSSLRTVLP